MLKTPRMTSDGLAILDRLFFSGRPARIRAVAHARLMAELSQEIYAARTHANLTQKKLAKLVGTTESVVSRIEDGDYRRLSFKLLLRIGEALNRRVGVHLVPVKAKRKSA